MKLLETLSNEEKISLLNGNVVGIFNNLILEGDSFYNKKYDLCLGYYFNRSGEKRISSMYEKILEIKNNISTENDEFQPMNANFGILPELEGKKIRDKRERYSKLAERSLKKL